MPSVEYRIFDKMKICIAIPDELIESAQKELNIKDKTTLVVLGLQELIKQSKIKKLRELRGKLNLQVDSNNLRERKNTN